nr:MAG TPA: hypothetical protein [Inoviridae sp.]
MSYYRVARCAGSALNFDKILIFARACSGLMGCPLRAPAATL